MELTQRKSTKALLSVLLFAAAATFVSSCSRDSDDFSGEDAQTSANESVQESTSDEIDDIANVTLNSYTVAGARTEAITDDRLICSGTTIDFTNVSEDKTSGTATITFGAEGCTDKKGNVRKGTIIISWANGKWYTVGSTLTITLTNYSVNDLKIAGTRVIKCTVSTLSPLSVSWIVYASHTFTWPDNTTATRIVNKTKKWDHTDTEDIYTVSNGPASVNDNAASGTNRHGKDYTIEINTPLVYQGSCVKAHKVFMPVSGVKVITAKLRTLTIDFGNGDCDNTYTVTVSGKSKTLNGKNDSSND